MEQETPHVDRQRGGDRGGGSGGDSSAPPRPPQKRRADPASEAAGQDPKRANDTTQHAEGGGSSGGAGGAVAGEAGADDAAEAGAARDLPPSVVEEGRLFLLYKPKVQVEEVKSMADVQRFFMVMEPTSPPGHRARLVVIPKKRLPSQDPRAKGKERFYGFVQATMPLEGEGGGAGDEDADTAAGGADEGGSKPQGNPGGEARGSNAGAAAAPAGEGEATADNQQGNQQGAGARGGGGGRPTTAGGGPARSGASALVLGLQGGDYDTKTRGRRHQGPARLLAEAAYVIGRGGSRNAPHLAYRLEVPLEPGPAQQLFCVGTAGDIILSIKNPENRPPGAPTAGPAPAQYNERQAKRLKGHAWVGAEDTSMLDVEGAELLLVGTGADDPAGHLGEVGRELDDLTRSEMEGSASEEEDGSEGSGGGNGEKDPQLQAVSKLRAIVSASSGAAAGAKADAAEQTPIPIEPAVTGKLV